MPRGDGAGQRKLGSIIARTLAPQVGLQERVRCAGRRSEPGGRMAQEREHGRSRDSEAGSHRGSHRDRSSDSGFASEAPSRYPSGPLAPMGSSGLPLSPSQGPLPAGEPFQAHY